MMLIQFLKKYMLIITNFSITYANRMTVDFLFLSYR